MVDLAGNTLRTANRSIGLLQTSARKSDVIGGLDRSDYYQFRVGFRSRLSLTLNRLTATADVDLLNGNGVLLQSSKRSGILAESIQRILTPGTYYARVYSGDRRSTSYNLNLSLAPQITVIDPNGGNTLTQGSGYWLRWIDNITENVRIDLYRDSNLAQTLTSSTISNGSFYWVPSTNLNPGTNYRIKITSTTNGALLDWSNASFTIHPAPQPDLTVQTPASPTLANVGELITISSTIRNAGTALAGTSTLRYWLSDDTTFNSGADVYLGDDAIASLSAGASLFLDHSFTYDNAWGTGTKYILFQVDGLNGVAESNEANNVEYRAIAISGSINEPGNTLATAILQSPVFALNHQVSSSDRDVIFRFTVNESGIFTADLFNLTGDADVRLIQDRDTDNIIDTAQLYNAATGLLETGEILAWQWERGTIRESIRRFLTAGTYYLQVSSYNNQTANYSLSTGFTAAASDSRQFTITPTYDSFINATARATIQKGINFWLAAIPSTSFNTAQNLAISFSYDPSITGSTLATGSYTSTAIAPNGRILPTAGVINLGADYLNNLNTISNYTPDTIIHEIAHVLGIVGLLNQSDNHVDLINESTGTYNGNSYAGWVYGELKGTYTQTAVPLTADSGAGSDLAHWKEEVFGNESMTDTTLGAIAAVSQLSLATLRDMGWEVNFGAAQPYSLPMGGLAMDLSSVEGTVTTNAGVGWNGYYGDSLNSEYLDRFYRFDFNGIGDLVVNLTGLTTNADMRLIYDANSNGLADEGEVIAVANNSGTANESLNFSNLAMGRYYIQVSAGSSVNGSGDRLISETSYQLSYNLAASDAPITTTLSPVTETWDMGRGLYSATSGMYQYSIGDRNIDDLLRFNFAGTTNLSFSLTGLTANVDMQLIRDANNNGLVDSGEVVRTATNTGSTSETITANGLAAGSYYFHIYRADSSVVSTSYSLNLDSLSIT